MFYSRIYVVENAINSILENTKHIQDTLNSMPHFLYIKYNSIEECREAYGDKFDCDYFFDNKFYTFDPHCTFMKVLDALLKKDYLFNKIYFVTQTFCNFIKIYNPSENFDRRVKLESCISRIYAFDRIVSELRSIAIKSVDYCRVLHNALDDETSPHTIISYLDFIDNKLKEIISSMQESFVFVSSESEQEECYNEYFKSYIKKETGIMI